MLTEYRPQSRDGLIAFIERNAEDLNVCPSEVVRRAEEWAASTWLLLAIQDDDALFHDHVAETIGGLVAIKQGANLSSRHVGSLRLAVDKDCWNEGLGTKLLMLAVERAPGLGIKRLEATPYTPLTPWKYHLFIDKGGFEIESVQRHKIFKGGELLDALMLVRFFRV
jgi:GNAT superfamily N-acetyltransferase